ncbi:single-stranded DNA-binding protein [Moraxella bovoculi]|uniref:single-stranded DNA-binding protein n=1 Tax=Moraxella bovoculi TaxID=386891 RepID=UPI0006244C93|nr:single-stranded DNA-binding protein [Moraxella bovoculi]AKG16600.1 single-stranded DNA-binding protein [Moraxella bovoculi]
MINSIILVGRLGQDPELYSFKNGSFITKFSVATSRYWNDRYTGARIQETEWHHIVANHILAKIAFQDFKKGDLVYIEGSLHYKKYRNQQNVEMYYTEIQAKQIYSL